MRRGVGGGVFEIDRDGNKIYITTILNNSIEEATMSINSDTFDSDKVLDVV